MRKGNPQPPARSFGQTNALPVLDPMKRPLAHKPRIPLHHDAGPRLPLAGPVFAAAGIGRDLRIGSGIYTGEGEARLGGIDDRCDLA